MGLPLKSQKGYKPGKLDIKAKQQADKVGSGYGKAKYKGGKKSASSTHAMPVPETYILSDMQVLNDGSTGLTTGWGKSPTMTAADMMGAIDMMGAMLGKPYVTKPKHQYNPYPEPDVEAITEGMTPEELAEMELLTGKKLTKAPAQQDMLVHHSDPATGELTVKVQALTHAVGETITYNNKLYTIKQLAKDPIAFGGACYYLLEPKQPPQFATGGLVTTTHTPEDGITYDGKITYLDIGELNSKEDMPIEVTLLGFELVPGQLVKFNGENHTVMSVGTGNSGKVVLKKGSHLLPKPAPKVPPLANKQWMVKKYKDYSPAMLEQEAHKIVKAATDKTLLVGDTLTLEGIAYEADVTGTGTFTIYQYIPKKLQAFIRAELFRLAMDNAGSAYTTLLAIHKQDEVAYGDSPHLYPSSYSSALYTAIHKPHNADWDAIMSETMAPDQAMVLTWMMSLAPSDTPKPKMVKGADVDKFLMDSLMDTTSPSKPEDDNWMQTFKWGGTTMGKMSSGPKLQQIPKGKSSITLKGIEKVKEQLEKTHGMSKEAAKAAIFAQAYGAGPETMKLMTTGFGHTGNQLPEVVKHPFCDNPECKYHKVQVEENKTHLIDYTVSLDWDSDVQNKLQRYYATDLILGAMVSLCPSCVSVVEMLGQQVYEWVPSI